MKKVVLLFVCCLAALSAAPAAEDDGDAHPMSNLYLTTRLLTAEPGSWIRRYAPSDYVYTTYVADRTGENVTLQQIKTHKGRLRYNRKLVLSIPYLTENAADPDAEGATETTVSHKDREYQAKAVEIRLSDAATATVYITDAVPATGVIRVDQRTEGSDTPKTLWTDYYGDEPDEMILEAGEPTPANDELGIGEG